MNGIGRRAWSFVFLVVFVAAGCGEAEHDDMSQVRVRGVVEGFYGPLYSFEQRRELFRFLGRAGMNAYIYAPKLDPYHRDEWRAPYAADYLEHFGELARLGEDIGVQFNFAISPGLTFDPAAGDLEVLRIKLRSIFDAGVRDFCLFFDDIEAGRPGSDPVVQADIVIAIRQFLRALDPGTSLTFISNFYAGTAAEFVEDRSPFGRLFTIPSSQYFAGYQRIPTDVPIMWTGPAVFSERISTSDAQAMRDYVQRPIWVWDNYPVNDALVMNELFLGPYVGRDAGLGQALDGILVNPMLQPEATKIPLWTIGRYLRDGATYDPAAAWEEALQIVTDGQGTAVVRLIAEQFASHPFIGAANESAAVAAAIEAFWQARTAPTGAALRAIFEELRGARTRLDAEVSNRALVAELSDPAAKLALYGAAGVIALDLLAAKAGGGAVDVTELTATLDEARAIRWLVGANTAVPNALATLIANRPSKSADVFGVFFERALTELQS